MPTSPGAINKELLLVGKKRDGRPFQLHTTWQDKAQQAAEYRNAWLALAALLAVFAVWKLAARELLPAAVTGALAVLLLIQGLRCHGLVRACRDKGAVEEQSPPEA